MRRVCCSTMNSSGIVSPRVRSRVQRVSWVLGLEPSQMSFTCAPASARPTIVVGWSEHLAHRVEVARRCSPAPGSDTMFAAVARGEEVVDRLDRRDAAPGGDGAERPVGRRLVVDDLVEPEQPLRRRLP